MKPLTDDEMSAIIFRCRGMAKSQWKTERDIYRLARQLWEERQLQDKGKWQQREEQRR